MREGGREVGREAVSLPLGRAICFWSCAWRWRRKGRAGGSKGGREEKCRHVHAFAFGKSDLILDVRLGVEEGAGREGGKEGRREEGSR